jgi:hypothetical protein
MENIMVYTLQFQSKFGLWELRISRFRIRFYRTRDEAMKTVRRYRRMLQAEQDRYEADARMQQANDFFERREARSNMQALWDVRG